MYAHDLRRSEVEYELQIRGVTVEGNADELRKKLTKCFSSKTEVDETVIAELVVDDELDICEEKFSDFSNLVDEYEGNTKDNEYRRTLNRLWHLYYRVERIPCTASMDNEAEKRKSALMKEVKSLLDGFMELRTKKKDLLPSEERKEDTSVIERQAVSNQTLLESLPMDNINVKSKLDGTDDEFRIRTLETSCSLKPTPVPVYKWGLTFNGEGNLSVAAFLERAEELKRARGVSAQELYASAVDLFSGTALTWYRSACHRILSWKQLKEELKLVFQSADYDDRLQLEILGRKQGDNESLDLYLAAMDGLFARLSVPISGQMKLQRILKNLNTFLQDKLCMFTIDSVDELRRLGRRAEAGRLRATTQYLLPPTSGLLEPDLACPSRQKKQLHRTLASMNTSRTNSSSARQTSRPLKCWNCTEEGHVYRNCTKEKKIFCFGCGKPGIRKSDCCQCKSKNMHRRGIP